MSTDQLGSLIYLVLLGSVIAFWVFVQGRETVNRKLQQAAVWALIFVGVIAGYGLWGDIRQATTFGATISPDTGEINVPRAPDGHYYLTLDINDRPVRFVVDTGATDMVLTLDDARAAGVAPTGADFIGQAMTANGMVRVAPVVLDSVAIGPVVDRNVRASVNEGDMDNSLLGMSYLQRFERIEISGGKMVLAR